MLEITVPGGQLWDEANAQFLYPADVTLQLEHSLVSLSKWEETWEKPFLGDDPKSNEETLDYVRCMTLNEEVDSSVYSRLTRENLDRISAYINKKMTATWFTEPPGPKPPPPKKQIITNEIIYYWMVAHQIPFECENWHLNKLFTLIKVCNEKNAPQKKNKMGRKDWMAQRDALNRARLQQYGTSG